MLKESATRLEEQNLEAYQLIEPYIEDLEETISFLLQDLEDEVTVGEEEGE